MKGTHDIEEKLLKERNLTEMKGSEKQYSKVMMTNETKRKFSEMASNEIKSGQWK